MACVKLNATMQSEMVARIDNYCSDKGMTRSAFLAMAATQYLDALDKKPVAMSAFGDIADLFKLAVTGKVNTKEYDDKLAALEAKQEFIKK